MSGGGEFRELGRLTGWLRTLLMLGAILALVSLVFSAVHAHQLSRSAVGELPADGDLELGLQLLRAVVFLVTALVFGRWILVANRHVRALGAAELPVSPGWAVG